ncbi:unnamed protein product [Cunninghamella echinulata]
MDIPNNNNGNVHLIPNIHPSHRSPNSVSPNNNNNYGTNIPPPSNTVTTDIDESNNIDGNHGSFSERIGSFVGSCGRTSYMYMAENVSVHSNSDLRQYPTNDYDDDLGSVVSDYIPSNRKNSIGTLHDERTSLLGYTQLDKVLTATSQNSVMTVLTVNLSHLKSTFIQSVFNSINILAGVGILALPLAFKYTGWIIGMSIFFFCLGLTNYTAKLVGRCLHAFPDSQTYGDMAYNSFGYKGRILVSALFISELITCSVGLVILLCDGLESLFPDSHPILLKVVAFSILTPMLFIPVRHLAYTSLIGIMSVFFIILVLLIDGFSKPDSPGSLFEAADTSMLPMDWMFVPKSFGLFMACFAGHAVFPTIYRDMQKPQQFTRMVNFTYLITAIIYFLVGFCGYRMFGSATMQEITQNLMTIPQYNPFINRLAVWLIAVNPIAKYSLTLNPVNLSWELAIFRHAYMENICDKKPWVGKCIRICGRIFISAFIVVFAYMVPEFDRIMSLLGACFSFIICGIFPIICYLKLFSQNLPYHNMCLLFILLLISLCLATLGTVWSFI